MANKGSNDLNLFLKAQVIKIRAELDVPKSMPTIKKQVGQISELLKDKPVKLRVALNATVTELNTQISQLTNRLNTAKTTKPVKIKVQIDVAGSAVKIKNQLKEITRIVNDFNKTYSGQVKEFHQNSQRMKQAMTSGMNVPVAGVGVQNFNNIKQYTEQLKQARQIMMSKLPAGEKGLFSSFEIKDAQGNLMSFIATLERANGVVDKVKYSFNQAKGAFEVVDRTTATSTEKHVHQAMQSLRELEKELIKTGSQAEKFRTEYNRMMQQGLEGNLTKDSVRDFKTKIENQKQSVINTRKENELLQTRKVLLKETGALLRDLPMKSNLADDVRKYKSELRSIPKDAFKTGEADAQLKKISASLKEIRAEYSKQSSVQSKLNSQKEKALKLAHDINTIEKQYGLHQTGALSARGVKEIEVLNKRIQKTKELAEAERLLERMTSKTNAIKRHRDEISILDKKEKVMKRIDAQVRKYFDAMSVGSEQAVHRIKRIREEFKQQNTDLRGMMQVEDMYRNRTERANRMFQLSSKSKTLDAGQISSFINDKDLDGLKNYISQMEKAKVQTASWIRTASGATKIRAEFEGIGKTVRVANFELDRAGRNIRVMGDSLAHNRRENLGVWEQLRIAMSRVPVWMGAMTVFYGSLRSIRAMSREILELDRVMTEFRRVASDKLNLEYAFQGAINLARELGNDVHGVTQTLADFARTYGEFNERQLLAITKTATLMSNVSDMEVEHAGNTLIAVSNAFGIVADESIRIVDAINEVDNNYAVSTQQLAEGLQRSASTARTFGVTMEENIGHITAISSVTMESGRIIGNSLKTIYSRITTMKPAEDILASIGVNIRKIGENGEVHVKPVSQIMGELAEKWWTLSDSQRQNIAVTLAGRYQLSRFLGLMNNYDIALNATRTAVTSHGSAMRENAEYLKSFEARINQLKVSFTEFAQAVGGAILSDALTALIDLLTSLATKGAEFVQKWGALPALLLTISLIAGKMGSFNKLTTFLTDFVGSVRTIKAENGVGILTATGTAIGEMGNKANTASKGLAGLSLSFRTLLVSSFVGIALAGVGVLIEKIIKARNEQKQLEKEARELKDNMISSYRGYADQMDGVIDRYDTLYNKQKNGIKLSIEEQTELAEVTSEIANTLPIATKYIDANGEAHLKTTAEIRKHVEEVEALSRAERELEIAEFTKDMAEKAKGFKEINDDIEKTAKSLENLNKQLDEGRFRGGSTDINSTPKEKSNTYQGWGITGGANESLNHLKSEATLRQEIAEKQVEQLMNEAKKTEHIQTSLRLIESQALAYFEVEGQLSKMNEAQKAVMENAISINEDVLRNFERYGFETFEEAMMGLKRFGEEVGHTFIEIYDEMESRAGNDPLKLESIKMQLDAFAKNIPEDLFRFDTGRTREDMDKMLKTIANVSEYIRVGHGDFDRLREILEGVTDAQGNSILTSQEAGSIIHRLGREYGNTAIDAQAFTDEVYDAEEAMEDFNSTALESIEIANELFGYQEDELSMITEISNKVAGLKATYGEHYREMPVYKELIGNLADITGVSIEKAEKYISVWGEGAQALRDIDYESGESYSKQVKKMENLSEDAKKFVLDVIKNGGDLDAFNKTVMQDITEFSKAEIEELKKLAEAEGLTLEEYIEKHFGLYDELLQLIKQEPEGDTTVTKHMKKTEEEVTESVDNIKGKLEEPLNPLGLTTAEEKLGLIKDESKEAQEGVSILRQDLEQPFPTTALDGLIEEFPNLSTSFTKEVDLVKATAGTIFDGVDFNLVTQDIKNAVKETLDMILELGEKVVETDGKFKELSKSITNSSLGDKLKELSEKIVEVIDTAKKLKDHIDKLGKADFEDITINIFNLSRMSVTAKENFDKLVSSLNANRAFNNLAGTLENISEKLSLVAHRANSSKVNLRSLASVSSDNLAEFVRNMGLLAGNMASAKTYGDELASSQRQLASALVRISTLVDSLGNILDNTGSSVKTMFEILSVSVIRLTSILIMEYNKNAIAVGLMRVSIGRHLDDMVRDFNDASTKSVNSMRVMNNLMYSEFVRGMDRIVSIASSVPERIGRAIRNNMNQASSAMDEVAKNMVARFKKELGIQSPSRVFEDLGGWVIKGLANGLTGADLKNLGKQVFDEFGGGAISSFQDIKDFLTFGGLGLNPNFGGKFTMTSPFGMRWGRLHAGTDYGAPMGTPIPAQAGGTVIRSGWAGGYGNLVEILGADGLTYRYAHNSRNMVAVGQKVKKGQIIGLVGSTGRSTGPHVHYEVRKNGVPINIRGKFAKGGFVDEHMIAEIGEEGLEAIIPLVAHRRQRGLDLWSETGELLGIDPEIIEMMIPKRGKGGSSHSSGSFGALSGEGGEGGGGDSGSSGIMRESIYAGGTGFDGDYMFTALQKAELYKPNKRERQNTVWEGTISTIEGQMQRMTELSLKYRNSLKDVIFYQNKILSNTRKELTALEKRNKSIDKQLKKLSNTSKHTEKQREKYNSLQQEFDSNLSKISSLKGNIQSLMNSVHEKSLQIFTNFIDEIVDKYDKAIAKIDKKVENFEFEISVLEFVDPDNLLKILNTQINKAHELQTKQATAQNRLNSLEKEYNKLQKKSSREAKYLKEQIDNAKKELQDVTLAVLRAEKDVKDQRSRVADESIKMLKDYYGNMRDMAIKAIDEEQKHVKKAHDEKMKNYDEEIKKVTELYDNKLKQLDKERNEEKYQEELQKKLEKRAELINKITLLSRNNTVEGRKKLSELENELNETNKDIAEFQRDKQRELLKEQIETQRDAHIEGINDKKTREEEEHNRYIEQLDEEKDAVTKKYDDLINNERRWAELHEEFVRGRFEGLRTELDDMNKSLEQMGRGIFDGLTVSFDTFSDEVKLQIKDMNKLTVDNMRLITESINKNVKAIADARKLIESQGKTTSTSKSKATKVETPKKTTSSSSSKSSSTSKSTTTAKKASTPKPVKVGSKAKVSAKNANAYMDSYGKQVRPWSAQAKSAGISYGASLYVVNERNGYVALGKSKSVNSAIAWVKKKDVVGLKTGGYTGDWSGDEGKMALLHKKELVLNEQQTKNYLDFAKIMDKVIKVTGVKRNLINPNNLTPSTVNNNSSSDVNYGGVEINIYDANKKRGKDIASEIMKELNKRGK